MDKVGKIFLRIFSIGVLLTLFAGGITILGFATALIIGGEMATNICVFIHKEYFPWVIRICSVSAAFGLIGMYINKTKALSINISENNAKEKSQ